MLGAPVELSAIFSGEHCGIGYHLDVMPVIIVVYVTVRPDIDGILQQRGEFCCGPGAPIQRIFVLCNQDILQSSEGYVFLGVNLKYVLYLSCLGGNGIQFLGLDIVDDGGDKFKAVGLSAAHVESHFAPVGVGLGDPVDGGCPFKFGEHHQDFHNQLSVRGGCVKGLLGRHEFYIVGLEFLKDVHEISQGAAHAVQLVYDYLADLILSDKLHHFLEAVPVDVPS